MSYLTMLLGPGARLNREHNLFVSESKHLYLDAKGHVRYQKKPLDRRTCGSRRILSRVVLLDVDSGAIYGELHDDETAHSLSDFLLRAWHPKAGHYLRGVPERLNLPAKVFDKPELLQEVRVVANPAGVTHLGPLPSGFAAGVHALRGFEQQITDTLSGRDGISLALVQTLSATFSYVAARSAFHDSEAWDQVRPVPPAAKQAVQRLSGTEYWCDGPFQRMFPSQLAEAADLAPFSTAQLMALGKVR